MSIPVSTVPAVKTYLLQTLAQQLQQEPGRQLIVCLDDPGQPQVADIVSIGQVHTRKAEPFQIIGSLGAGSMMENYRVVILVTVFRGGNDQAWPIQRAWNLASAVESVCRTDPSLGGLAVVSYPCESRERSGWEENGKGRVVDIEIELYVEAQI